jgi:hypothetical protein
VNQPRAGRPAAWRRLAATVSPEAVALGLVVMLAVLVAVTALPR